jgi:hypothetical protein
VGHQRSEHLLWKNECEDPFRYCCRRLPSSRRGHCSPRCWLQRWRPALHELLYVLSNFYHPLLLAIPLSLIVPHLDQLVVTGGGSASPATVNFPGAYKASDPGILINIHAAISSYTNPGPAVYAGGSSKVAGSKCSGVEAGTSTGPSVIQTATGTPGTGTGGGCTAEKFQQCGGQGYTGCTTCAVSSLVATEFRPLQIPL